MTFPWNSPGMTHLKMHLKESIDRQPDQLLSYPYFAIIKDWLYRVTQDTQSKEDTTLLLVPKSHREMLFYVAHCIPMAGHLGEKKTLICLMAWFFWLGIHVCRLCASCLECQLVNPPATSNVPFQLLPLMEVPLHENWHEPRRAIRMIGTRASFCISPSGLCNTISWSSRSPHHFS